MALQWLEFAREEQWVGYAAEGCGSGKGRPVNKKLAKVPGAGAGSSG